MVEIKNHITELKNIFAKPIDRMDMAEEESANMKIRQREKKIKRKKNQDT